MNRTINALADQLQSIIAEQSETPFDSFRADQLRSEYTQIVREAEQLGYFFSSYDRIVVAHEYSEDAKAQIRSRNG